MNVKVQKETCRIKTKCNKMTNRELRLNKFGLPVYRQTCYRFMSSERLRKITMQCTHVLQGVVIHQEYKPLLVGLLWRNTLFLLLQAEDSISRY